MPNDRPRFQASRVATIAVAAIAAVVFWRTAYPTVTWWDSSSYSLAAFTLGINSPPGSLLLTLIGWPVAHLPFGSSPAHTLNLFAGVMAASVVALAYVVALDALRIAGVEVGASWAVPFGAAAGALTLAFGGTLWTYAIQFTPYVLSAMFTGLILWTMLRWWTDAERPESWRWLALLALLFGLDFSVHRTNALLIPGALAWVLIRQPAAFRSTRTVLASAGALAAGLATQLLLIPIAATTQSTLNFSEPSTLQRLWDYITLKQLGGSFLLQLFPRRSPPWTVQTTDVLRVLRDNYLQWSGPAKWLGMLPAVAAMWGLVTLWRGNRRLAAALTGVLVLQGAFTVLYFNIPADFFRTFDRHYLPICVTIGVFVASGIGGAMALAAGRFRRPTVAVAAALVATVPASRLWNNWSANDASRRYFTRDYAANALLGLPANAIYFTVGDNDTFPVLYLQSVEGVRPDVTVINLSVANIPFWPEQLTRRDPSFPLSLSREQRAALSNHRWTDTVSTVRVAGTTQTLGLPAGASRPESIRLNVRPMYGGTMLPAEIVLLDIVRTNMWKRPLAFAGTGTEHAMEWLAPYGRVDGLHFTVVPVINSPVDTRALRHLLLDVSSYRGYADSTVRIDGVSRTMGLQSYGPLMSLLSADAATGNFDVCRADRSAAIARLPYDRLAVPPDYRAQIESACGDDTPRF